MWRTAPCQTGLCGSRGMRWLYYMSVKYAHGPLALIEPTIGERRRRRCSGCFSPISDDSQSHSHGCHSGETLCTSIRRCVDVTFRLTRRLSHPHHSASSYNVSTLISARHSSGTCHALLRRYSQSSIPSPRQLVALYMQCIFYGTYTTHVNHVVTY